MRIPAISFLLISLLVLAPITVKPQVTFRLKKTEQELKDAFIGINQGDTDSTRLALSLDFEKQFRIALNLQGSADYTWDSLKYVAKIESPDGLFRLYNWNVPLINGGNRYFCLVQFRGRIKKLLPVALTDHSDSIPEPGSYRGDSLHWYGALYYKVIPFELKDKKNAYILLGWDGISREISSKLIEVLTFRNDGIPEFGFPVFPDYLDGKCLRIIFRYASTAGMNLRYQLQTIPGKPVWNNKKREYTTDSRSRWMIAFDHLVPIDPQLEGQYKFYVPASETAEGFIYENYRWNYIKEFDARNP
ncbi:MAG: hypothetical protein NTY96_00515 [Bacteroidetes bacterium]|nr:hypothetical protein [Bacteroidota bacterium]